MRRPNRDAPSGTPPQQGYDTSLPHRRPPGSCGGPIAMPPSGTPPRQGYGTPSGAPLRLQRRPPRHMGAACGGPNSYTSLWHIQSAGLLHTPPARPSAHIGGLPGHAAAQQPRPPLAHPHGRATAHPSGEPLSLHRWPPRACGGPNSDNPSGTPPRLGYGTPLRRDPPPT